MSDFNSAKNRIVWADIPVVDLDRAVAFYAAVLAIPVHKESFGDMHFAILDHQDGNGACLFLSPGETSAKGGILVYFNADGRIRDAVAQAEKHGARIEKPVHSIGPHGFRAVLVDTEGNRIALHSNLDA